MSRILVVDDNDVDREQVRRCLEPIDEVVLAYAHNGEDALEMLEAAEAPDLVVTDLRMPGMTGLELVKRLGADYPLIPVILMTAQGSEETAKEALLAGAASYVPKRALDEELVETVEQILMVAAARRARAEILQFLRGRETRFELHNDLLLIPPLIAYVEDSLARIGFADPGTRGQIGMALMEAIANAMLHGNLECESELRRDDRAAFDRQIAERQADRRYGDRKLLCEAHESPATVEYVITDEGPGFDPASLPDPAAPENVLAVSGRGVLLMRTFMDEVRFNDKGNRVTLVKHAPDKSA